MGTARPEQRQDSVQPVQDLDSAVGTAADVEQRYHRWVFPRSRPLPARTKP